MPNRFHYIIYNGFRSTQYPIVPQGSNLGPLLFQFYINEITNCTADDLKNVCYKSTDDDCVHIQSQLNKIVSRFHN